MSIALVIKNSNFSQNSLDRISFSGSIPCTDLTVDRDNIIFENVGQEETVNVTVLPSDTTDTLIITSANEDIVTVKNNVLAVVGIGSTVVNFKCGSQSVVVNVTATTLRGKQLVRVDGRDIQQYQWNDPHSMRVGNNTSGSVLAYPFVEASRAENMYYGADYGVESISIPKGATTIRLASTSKTGFSFDRTWFGKIGDSVVSDIVYASAIEKKSVVDSLGNGFVDISIPTDCDCFAISTTNASAHIADDYYITFS